MRKTSNSQAHRRDAIGSLGIGLLILALIGFDFTFFLRP